LFIAVPSIAPSRLDSVPGILIFVYPHTDGYGRAIHASAKKAIMLDKLAERLDRAAGSSGPFHFMLADMSVSTG
jgi:hypothetical protein